MGAVTHIKTGKTSVNFTRHNGFYLIEKRLPGSRPQIIYLTEQEVKNFSEYVNKCQPKHS